MMMIRVVWLENWTRGVIGLIILFSFSRATSLKVKWIHFQIKKTYNFSLEKEEDGRLPFLDINIFRENDKFATNFYRKKTFSGFIPTWKVL